MRNRSKVVICWEVLRALASGPQGPSRLARVANVPFDRLDEYLGPLVSAGLVRREADGEREVYRVTPEGMQALGDLDRVLPKLL
jgi:predicted transcriptional regulator